MKRIFFRLFTTCTLLFLLISNSQAAEEKLIIDPNHSYVLWQINHLGFSTQSGKWYASGTLLIDKDQPQNAQLNVSIPIDKIITGNAKLETHLRSPEFFDTARFPTATFVSNKIDLTGNDTANVHGILTLHGVSKPVTLKVKLNKTGVSPVSQRMTAGFSATSTIKRSDFGIKTFLPALGDEVKLTIEAEAYKPNNE